jgi:hypothetical protein
VKLPPDDIQTLRDAVKEMDRLDGEISQKDEAIIQAEAAVARLGEQLTALRAEQDTIARAGLVTGTSRIAALIAGKPPGMMEADAIAEKAERTRIVNAHAEQIELDLEGVRGHLAREVATRDNVLKPERDRAEAAFLEKFADAGFRAYQAAAVAFVAEHLPPLEAVASAVIQRDPNRSWPNWWSHLSHLLRVQWPGPTGNPDDLVWVWPRRSNRTLVCGTPLPGKEGIPGLIDAVRQGNTEF